MAISFGSLTLVDKTFKREAGAPRGQSYTGIKFRRSEVKDENDVPTGEVKEFFVISDAAFDKLGLANLALAQANLDDAVLLLVVEDQEEVEPVAKFMKQSTKKDGTKQAKGKMFSNVYLQEALVERKVLTLDTTENQFIALEDVTALYEGTPSVVKAIYKLSIDETVGKDADAENDKVEDTLGERNF